jgi:phosphatidylinositol alpha-mannosyltransferase
MKRRIIFSNYDDPKNPFYGGGGARAIHEVAKRLAVRHDVKIITGSYPGSRDEIVDGVSYARIGSDKAGPKSGQLLFQFLLPIQVRREAFDVWVESLTPPFSTACLQLFTKQPVIALTQVLGGKAMSRKYHLPFGGIERFGLKTYRHVIALSDFIKAEVLAANPRAQVAVIPNGVESELIDRPVAKEEAHILFLGRIDVEQKGIDLLLNACHRISAQLPIKMLIAGSGATRDEQWVARRVDELGLKERVEMVGRIEGAEKFELLRRAMFLVMPSRFEGFPLTLVEAFCFQMPVILFAIPELTWLPDTCCVKVTPFDEAAFGRAILELARDHERRHAMGAAAKLFARQFSWDDLARKYEEFFETALQTR